MARADALLILTENPTNVKVEGYQYGCKPGKHTLVKFQPYSGEYWRVRIHATSGNFEKLHGKAEQVNELFQSILQERGLRE